MTIRDLEDSTMEIKTSEERATTLRSMLLAGIIDKKIYKYLKFRCTDLRRNSSNRYCLEKDAVYK